MGFTVDKIRNAEKRTALKTLSPVPAHGHHWPALHAQHMQGQSGCRLNTLGVVRSVNGAGKAVGVGLGGGKQPDRQRTQGPWDQHPAASLSLGHHKCLLHPPPMWGDTHMAALGPGACHAAFHLPATHREVRDGIVVGLQHPGVFEDVIPKRVEPV